MIEPFENEETLKVNFVIATTSGFETATDNYQKQEETFFRELASKFGTALVSIHPASGPHLRAPFSRV